MAQATTGSAPGRPLKIMSRPGIRDLTRHLPLTYWPPGYGE